MPGEATADGGAGSPPAQDPGSAYTQPAALEAYRGFIVLFLLAAGLRVCRVAAAVPDNGFWKFLCQQQSHVEWVGCTLYDLIQPSISFLVGAALPFSLAARAARGESSVRILLRGLWGSLGFVLLGIFLRSLGRAQTNWTFEDSVSQIGLGYLFLVLLARRPLRDQLIGFTVLLIGYWAAFGLYPMPGADFDYARVGVTAPGPQLLSGFAAHWNMNSNPAWAFDTWFLNLFPRDKPFVFNGGGYSTLSFIPTLGTMILGLMAGETLRSERVPVAKVKLLCSAGLGLLLLGASLGWLGICPVVKKIWTPSWTLFSGGWCLLLTAGFYAVIEYWNHRRWAFPLVLVGRNWLFAYCLPVLFNDFIAKTIETHFGPRIFTVLGEAYQPLLRGAAILLVWWLLLFWMDRRKLYLRI